MKQETQNPEPGTCADSGQQEMSREKFWGYGGLFQESPGVSPTFLLLHRKKKLAISGRMCYNKCTSGAAGTGGASSRKAEGKEEPS